MTLSDIAIRPAKKADIESIAHIAESSCKNPWSFYQLEEELKYDFSRLFIAKSDGEICGFLNCHVVRGDAHINELAVEPQHRRRGIGKALVLACIEDAKRNGAVAVGLEVRSENTSAIKLYKSLGFEAIGERRGFYRDPDDSAVIMKLSL